MICEKCKEQGLKSRVSEMGCSKTLLGYRPFYDENGKRHYHNPNVTTTSYKCSNGHSWETKSRGGGRYGRCWCGWPDKEGAVDH